MSLGRAAVRVTLVESALVLVLVGGHSLGVGRRGLLGACLVCLALGVVAVHQGRVAGRVPSARNDDGTGPVR